MHVKILLKSSIRTGNPQSAKIPRIRNPYFLTDFCKNPNKKFDGLSSLFATIKKIFE